MAGNPIPWRAYKGCDSEIMGGTTAENRGSGTAVVQGEVFRLSSNGVFVSPSHAQRAGWLAWTI